MAFSFSNNLPEWRDRLHAAGRRGGAILASLLLLGVTLGLAFALASYRPADPALNTAAAGPVRNLIGSPGAWFADIALSLFGPVAALILALPLIAALRLWRGAGVEGWKGDLGRAALAVLIVAIGLGLAKSGAVAWLPAGLGGIAGLVADQLATPLFGLLIAPWDAVARAASATLIACTGLFLWQHWLRLDAVERNWLRHLFTRGPRAETIDDLVEAPVRKGPPRSQPATLEAIPPPVITEPTKPRGETTKPTRAKQGKLGLGDTYELPSLALLAPPPPGNGPAIDKAALEKNARLLETVLDDFHVKGRIVEVRPGPVVTMYELEPAAGIRASRVVALADDIARNMSAQSARVATIPGRSVIGIELPNAKREMVSLSELIGSDLFEDVGGQLPLVLGKNIAGDPVIADLAPMPHLLVAGTTGSGKSVGLNCMILSLLYRLTPEQCRMIMIDPKMLELSIYDDIPHLLSPVVTEPQKAIRALKWAVEQMEERYRLMASVGVRSLANFNERVRAAKAKGQSLGRRVQTGYDAETGQPVYEEEKLEAEAMPQIVVIVDELADLMMTAGKEVEFLIQRLAQKARAAGIHLIMATQRPSVDVITGVIKANLPTRISFQVTSKIDSRTILGEQGAEQLLGKGDMLYMPGGKQIARVHGPFVSDEEVRAVADHWRAQGTPEYVQAVTEEPAEGGWEMEGAPNGPDDPETQMYLKAVQLVVENRKASTSWLQRQLRIGYNSAARLIERMEKDDIISMPDHVGRREVLVDVADLGRILGR